VACLYTENRVVIQDLETGDQKVIKAKLPLKCVASQCIVVVTTCSEGLYLLNHDGDLIHVVPDSTNAICAAFHPHSTDILAIGFKDGSVCIWNVRAHAYTSSLKHHTDRISSIGFTRDCKLLLSSWDKTASIISISNQSTHSYAVKLESHSHWVTDIMPLPSTNQCVTCSLDKTIKVWDSQTGQCIRTLTEHGVPVNSLSCHPSQPSFTSANSDRSATVWSTDTFEGLRRIAFPNWIQSLVCGENHTMYVGVVKCGVMQCDALTGEAGPVVIRGKGQVYGLALGMSRFVCFSS
jgi:WD40 repeat protein